MLSAKRKTDSDHTIELLKQRKRNLEQLRSREAKYAAKDVPTDLFNSIADEAGEIARLTIQLLNRGQYLREQLQLLGANAEVQAELDTINNYLEE